jgi:hypothetical protein
VRFDGVAGLRAAAGEGLGTAGAAEAGGMNASAMTASSAARTIFLTLPSSLPWRCDPEAAWSPGIGVAVSRRKPLRQCECTPGNIEAREKHRNDRSGGTAGKSGGRSRRPSPQSPKGILGSSSPFGAFIRTPCSKRN